MNKNSLKRVVILAGGFGTRLSEETSIKPKPMVEIGGRPILWHIMKIYSHYGFNDFIICLGYKGYIIKEYFANYFLHQSDVTIDLSNNSMEIHNNSAEPWKVTLVDTGEGTMTGGRLLRVKSYIHEDEFMMTYGDGVADIDIAKLIEFHHSHNQLATVTAAQPTGRFGALHIEDNQMVSAFQEKPSGDGSWVNAGFFILRRGVFDYLTNDSTVFEKEPLQNLAKNSELRAFNHAGFWMPMDKLSDKIDLEKLWSSGEAPWKLWK
ncbi:MAG: glucose-1-phosphate cytidylyltransferase [Ignavibacteriaceae bacterium]|nr:glucose-1-phosphate cytidylyltransferase [Ignavibacteriaceae bacterium]